MCVCVGGWVCLYIYGSHVKYLSGFYFRFHYNVIKAKYGDRASLLFTDTDSLVYSIQTEDLYQDMWNDKHLYDLSDYPTDSNFYEDTNKKVVGKMKDEVPSGIVAEVVALKPKVYSIKIMKLDSNGGVEYTTKKVLKGVQRDAQSVISHADYKKELENPEENTVTTRRIGSKLHKLYSIEVYHSAFHLLIRL